MLHQATLLLGHYRNKPGTDGCMVESLQGTLHNSNSYRQRQEWHITDYISQDGGQDAPDKQAIALGTVSITFYRTTSRIHVQGSSYLIWLEEHYPSLRTQAEQLAAKLGKAISDQQKRQSGRQRRHIKALGSITPPGKCHSCDTVLHDSMEGGYWSCQLCGDSFHGLCAQSASPGDEICTKCSEHNQHSSTKQPDTNHGDPHMDFYIENRRVQDTSETATTGEQDQIDQLDTEDNDSTEDCQQHHQLQADQQIAQQDQAADTHSAPEGPNIGTATPTSPTASTLIPRKAPTRKPASTRGSATARKRSTKASKRVVSLQKEVVSLAQLNSLQRTVRALEHKYVSLVQEVQQLRKERDTTSATTKTSTNAKPCEKSIGMQTEPQKQPGDVLRQKVLELEMRVSSVEKQQNQHQPPPEAASSSYAKVTMAPKQPRNNKRSHSTETPTSEAIRPPRPTTKSAPASTQVENRFSALRNDEDTQIVGTDAESAGTAPLPRPHTTRRQNANAARNADTHPRHRQQEQQQNRQERHVVEDQTHRVSKVDVLIVTSSIGKALDGHKMYRRNRTHIQHLRNGRNIAEAKDFIQKTRLQAQKVVFIVGSNDLSGQKSVSKTQVEMDDLLHTTRRVMGQNVEILISEIMPRTGRHFFNKKAEDFNARVFRVCQQNRHMYFIPQQSLFDECHRYDGVHLEYKSVPLFVRNIKSVLNPLLGLTPISEYHPVSARDSRSQKQDRTAGRERHNSGPRNVSTRRQANGEETITVPKPAQNISTVAAELKDTIIAALSSFMNDRVPA